jgi:hypothetical protein
MMRNENFRLSKSTKRILATYVTGGKAYKEIMIGAEVTESEVRKKKLFDKKEGDKE